MTTPLSRQMDQMAEAEELRQEVRRLTEQFNRRGETIAELRKTAREAQAEVRRLEGLIVAWGMSTLAERGPLRALSAESQRIREREARNG